MSRNITKAASKMRSAIRLLEGDDSMMLMREVQIILNGVNDMPMNIKNDLLNELVKQLVKLQLARHDYAVG